MRGKGEKGDGAGPEDAQLLSLVVPTRNESATAPLLIARLADVLADVPADVIFVDDSDDDTPQIIEREGAESGLQVRVVHRDGVRRRGGLSTAVVEGIRAAGGRYVCIMDADLQHPPDLIIAMLRKAQDADADIVIASRNVRGGSDAGLNGLSRKAISWVAKWLVKALFPSRLRGVTDPLSGFFLVRRGLLADTVLRPIGFKILLDILIRTDSARVKEVPLRFAPRAAGVSKATLSQGKDFLAHTLILFWHRRFDGAFRRRRSG
ncbi:MAG: polyprenol monophosphomannose synthase [Dehalococcoidia bacterium]|nr:polyprenol monophosphomannose synthase [Dehalococcoidia bacterium]